MTDSRNPTGAIQMNSETTTLTTMQAAIAAGCRVNSVMQAILGGQILAEKNTATNRWLIDRASFDAWNAGFQARRNKTA